MLELFWEWLLMIDDLWFMVQGSWFVGKEGSYLRLIDSCINQLKAQGSFRTCNESKEDNAWQGLCGGWEEGLT